ncbi:MAG TPA: SMP-30/gluconolactonase/LRE family protein, partial [Planctomycetaceae bacterium]
YDTATGGYEVIADGVDSNDLVVDEKGGVYFTDPPNGRVWYVASDRSKRVVAKGLAPNGVILTPDAGTLVVTDRENPWLWAFRVHEDGSLDGKDSYYRPLVVPYGEERPRSDGMTVDADGRLYVATAVGIQVFDPTGRPCGTILRPLEARTSFGSNVAFGGPGRDWLYYTVTDKVYRRKVQSRGVTFDDNRR